MLIFPTNVFACFFNFTTKGQLQAADYKFVEQKMTFFFILSRFGPSDLL
jgi:hypothetical protein